MGTAQAYDHPPTAAAVISLTTACERSQFEVWALGTGVSERPPGLIGEGVGDDFEADGTRRGGGAERCLRADGSGAAQAAAPSGSDLGPVGRSSGSGDPNLGVLNDGTRTLNFDGGWRFELVNTADTSDPTGRYGNSTDPKADAPGFDDSAWQRLTLPHDWSITQAPDPSQSNATGFFPGGLGWYRKTFTLPASMAGKRISLDFDGVFENSYVYLNGQLLGNHPYGYTGYSYDITDLVHADGHTPNVLAVVVQNQEPSSRWYSGQRDHPARASDRGQRAAHRALGHDGDDTRSGDHDRLALRHRPRGHPAGQRQRPGAQVDVHYLVRDAAGHVVADATTAGVNVPSTARPAPPTSAWTARTCGRRRTRTSTRSRHGHRVGRAARQRRAPPSGCAGWCSARPRA